MFITTRFKGKWKYLNCLYLKPERDRKKVLGNMTLKRPTQGKRETECNLLTIFLPLWQIIYGETVWGQALLRATIDRKLWRAISATSWRKTVRKSKRNHEKYFSLCNSYGVYTLNVFMAQQIPRKSLFLLQLLAFAMKKSIITLSFFRVFFFA